MKKFVGFERGMGMGGWLTNYKRFQLLTEDKREILTIGDLEHFQTYITERDVQYIASVGFDHIRLGFDQIVMQNTDGSFREEHFKLLENFVGWCEKYHINAVLNLHKAIGNYCDVESTVHLIDSERLQNNFVALWLEMERRFSKATNVAFELLNEVNSVDPDKWNALATRTIDGIRAMNKDRIIIYSGAGGWSVEGITNMRVYDDEKIIYTFHFYSPFEFTHQRGVLQKGPMFYNRDMPYPCDVERYRDYNRVVWGLEDTYPEYERIDKQFLYDCLAPAKAFIDKHPDKIMWCGEFGNIRHAKLEWRIAWFKDVITFLKENGIPYSVWNYLSTPNDGNRFSLVDDDKREILSEEFKNVLLGNF
jgi:hypothetical protein